MFYYVFCVMSHTDPVFIRRREVDLQIQKKLHPKEYFGHVG